MAEPRRVSLKSVLACDGCKHGPKVQWHEGDGRAVQREVLTIVARARERLFALCVGCGMG